MDVQKLLSALGPNYAKIVQKGSIINFRYIGQTREPIHDPYPLVLISDIFPSMIRGVNLHYLTLPYIKGMIANYANNPNFSYRYIKGDNFLVDSFRSYKRGGMSQLKMLDVAFLKKVLQVSRTLNPGEVEQIRDQIKQSMAQWQS